MVGASSGLSNAVRPSPAILWDVRQRRVLDFLKQIGTKISVMISLQTQGCQVIYRSVTGHGPNIFYFLSVRRQGSPNEFSAPGQYDRCQARTIGGRLRTRKGSVEKQESGSQIHEKTGSLPVMLLDCPLVIEQSIVLDISRTTIGAINTNSVD